MHAVLDILFSVPAFVVLACVASLVFEWKGDRRNMMESIEKLREWSRRFDDMYVMEEGDIYHIYSRPLTESMKSCGELMREQYGEIEREIAERYMPLPVDADGVPIRVNDWIEVYDKKPSDKRQRVEAVATHSVFWWEKDGCHWTQGFMCRHANPRTIEDVLIDAMQFGFSSHAGDDVTNKAREFAAEIRKLMEVDR